MTDCLFCKIIAGDIPSDTVYETDSVLVFRDIDPKAPTHLLAIPKVHIATNNDLTADNAAVVGDLFLAAKAVAKQEQLPENAYRLVMNVEKGAGQVVFHMHLHILGGRDFQWPPG